MEMCYDGALVMPSSYAVMNEEEMTYVEGGMKAWQKAAIIAGVGAAGVGLVVALSYGQIWIGAKIMKVAIGAYVHQLGAKAVATVVAGSLGISVGICTAAVTAILSL